ncbi:MAG TPA: hypothetical protein DCZ69_03280 [Syntrophobacteraceae bacterium]|jgi:hypothetical protein|nr:hypothetical protein [Syntrophobacteraceae bacterium]HBD07260.1 hypothetical protein [Syntrophobacteraceae bacterium]
MKGNSEVVGSMGTAKAVPWVHIQATPIGALLGAGVLVTGDCGPKALQVLPKDAIKVYHTSA